MMSDIYAYIIDDSMFINKDKSNTRVLLVIIIVNRLLNKQYTHYHHLSRVDWLLHENAKSQGADLITNFLTWTWFYLILIV